MEDHFVFFRYFVGVLFLRMTLNGSFLFLCLIYLDPRDDPSGLQVLNLLQGRNKTIIKFKNQDKKALCRQLYASADNTDS